jgi:mono/diheme cytochrome c family protein
MNSVTKFLLKSMGFAACLLLVAGSASQATAEDTKPEATHHDPFSSPARFEEQGGEAIYRHVCAGCHQPDAKGAIGAGAYPALAHNEKLESAGYPVSLVLHGQKAMPPLGGFLTDQQVADVVNYVRNHFGNSYDDAVDAALVKGAR